MNADQILALFVESLKPYAVPALGIVVLIFVDLLTGIGSAIRAKAFSFDAVADFYRSSVLPQFVGWVAITVGTSALAALAVDQLALPAEVGTALSGTQAWAMLSTVYLTLLSSILNNLKEIQAPEVIEVVAKSPEA